jgi:hypothetical protein
MEDGAVWWISVLLGGAERAETELLGMLCVDGMICEDSKRIE